MVLLLSASPQFLFLIFIGESCLSLIPVKNKQNKTHTRNVNICSGFQARKIIKKLIHRTKRKKIYITADTAHLLNRMGLCACACFSTEHLYVMCAVYLCHMTTSMDGQHHFSESQAQQHLDLSTGSTQTSCCSVTAWTRPLHFLADYLSH